MMRAAVTRRGGENLLHLRLALSKLALLQQTHAQQEPALGIVWPDKQHLLIDNLRLGPSPASMELNSLRQAHCGRFLSGMSDLPHCCSARYNAGDVCRRTAD